MAAACLLACALPPLGGQPSTSQAGASVYPPLLLDSATAAAAAALCVCVCAIGHELSHFADGAESADFNAAEPQWRALLHGCRRRRISSEK